MPESTTNQIARRADDILLKLLDGIERDIKEGTLPSPYIAAYEAMCRTERTRLGG